jgi:hypothetical protein
MAIDPEVLKQVMSELGRKGGKIGGKARMDLLSQEERAQLGRMAGLKSAEARKKKKAVAKSAAVRSKKAAAKKKAR